MIIVKRKIEFIREAHGRRRVQTALSEEKQITTGRIPRISRLMAVAIRMERLLRTGEVTDISELARIGHVTQPRMSQIMALNLLAPDIQEKLLFLPAIEAGKPKIHEKMLRPVTAIVEWKKQREKWEELVPVDIQLCTTAIKRS